MLHFPDNWKGLDVVLCHDWLTGMRGGEKVLEILCQAFPRAEIYTLLYDRDRISDTINAHSVHTSFLQNMPGIQRCYRNLLPLFPLAVRSLKIRPATLLISTSHCVAKSAVTSPATRHLCYCFTPMRYAWALQDEYFRGRPLASAIATPMLAAIRNWDRRSASRVDRFVSISQHIHERLQRAYGRDSDIVFPPVDVERITPASESSAEAPFDLVVSALVPYKRVDLAVRAYTESGPPLKVVGTGTEYSGLRDMAGENVEFLGWQSDDAILDLYRTCRFLLFPGEEDFGIVPVEAQACGKPVIAYRKGGALETVRENDTGVFFEDHTVEGLLAAVKQAQATPWNADRIRAHAESFGEQRFVDGLADSINAVLSDRKPE